MSSGKRKNAPKYAKFAVARSTIGITKFRRRKYSAGIKGCSALRIRWTNAAVITSDSAKVPRHHLLGHLVIESPTLGQHDRYDAESDDDEDQLEPEERSPTEGRDDRRAQRHPDDRSARTHQTPPAHGLHPLFATEHRVDQRARRRAGGGALDPVEGSREQQH